ncbi:MAG: cytochrome c [Phycisphaerae bacterium]|nr:cytochrome c [Phycisphaerae bacterium]
MIQRWSVILRSVVVLAAFVSLAGMGFVAGCTTTTVDDGTTDNADDNIPANGNDTTPANENENDNTPANENENDNTPANENENSEEPPVGGPCTVLDADPDAGEAVYSPACAGCHGEDAAGPPSLLEGDPTTIMYNTFGDGAAHMGQTLTEDEIRDITCWLFLQGQ